MTRETFNTEVAAILSDSVADASIDPSDVATAMGKAADYAESLIVAKTVKVNITHAELLLLNTNPKELLPAVVGKAYLPLHFLFKYKDNMGWGTPGTPWVIKSGSIQFSSFNSLMGSSTYTEQIIFAPGGITFNADTYFNKALTLTATTNPSSPSNVESNVDVYITYFEVTL